MLPARSSHAAVARTARALRCCLTHQRPFHSYDHPAPPGPFGVTEEAILAAAWRHIPEHGFSHRALSIGARDAGYLDISPSALPEGTFSLIRYHLVKTRKELSVRSRHILEGEKAPPGVGAKVAALTWERLLANEHVIHRWQDVRPLLA